MRSLISLALLMLWVTAPVQAVTAVYAEITYPTPTTWSLWLTETEDWNGTTSFTPSGYGIAGFAIDVAGVTTASKATPSDVALFNDDDPPTLVGMVGFPIGAGSAFVTGGVAQVFAAQNPLSPECLFAGFGVTAGTFVPPAGWTTLSPYSWEAPGAPGSANPGVLVFRGKRNAGQTVSVLYGSEAQVNVFENAAFSVITVEVVGSSLPPANRAPTVHAGPDQIIAPGTTASLAGSVTDDGLPDPPATMTVTWSLVSGPGTVGFGDDQAAATMASFSAPGIYRLRLTASDSELNSTDDVLINVTENQAPVADAGTNQVIPTGMIAILAGSVSDDGLPNPPAATRITWSMTSGPANVTFTDANAALTSVRFAKFGTYVLHLRANDSARTADDEVTLIVHADPPGDFTGDGHVTGADFLIWQQNYPTLSGATRAKGDGNGDGRVTGMDFMLWQIDFGLEHQ